MECLDEEMILGFCRAGAAGLAADVRAIEQGMGRRREPAPLEPGQRPLAGVVAEAGVEVDVEGPWRPWPAAISR